MPTSNIYGRDFMLNGEVVRQYFYAGSHKINFYIYKNYARNTLEVYAQTDSGVRIIMFNGIEVQLDLEYKCITSDGMCKKFEDSRIPLVDDVTAPFTFTVIE